MQSGLRERLVRAARRWWSAETGIFLGIWTLLMVGGRSRLFRDPGTFWHTVVGERILASRQFIRADAFSFTCAGKAWVAYEWLGECAMALVHALSGDDGLLLATVTILACLYTWAAGRLIRAGLHWMPATLLTGLMLGAGTMHFHVRPHILTLLCFGLTYAWLCDFEAGRIGLGRLLWLVPLDWAWANTHGGMLGGLCTMGLAVGGWSLAKLLGWPTPLARGRDVLCANLLVLACALTVLVNPYGLDLPRTWMGIVASPLLPRIIQEHRRLNPAAPDGMLVLLFGLVYAAVLAGALPRRPRVTWLLPLVWLVLAWTRIRHAPLFGLAAGLALADLLPQTRWAGWLARPGRDLFRPEPERASRSWRPALLPLGLVAAALVLEVSGIPAPVVGRGWAKLDPTYWPVELIPELQRYEREHPEGTRIFNDYPFGGFLIRYTPRLRVFIDDRCEVYGDEGLAAYVHAMQGEPSQIERWAREYGFEVALIESGSEFDRYLGSARGWELVRRTTAASLYQKVTSDKPERSDE